MHQTLSYTNSIITKILGSTPKNPILTYRCKRHGSYLKVWEAFVVLRSLYKPAPRVSTFYDTLIQMKEGQGFKMVKVHGNLVTLVVNLFPSFPGGQEPTRGPEVLSFQTSSISDPSYRGSQVWPVGTLLRWVLLNRCLYTIGRNIGHEIFILCYFIFLRSSHEYVRSHNYRREPELL